MADEMSETDQAEGVETQGQAGGDEASQAKAEDRGGRMDAAKAWMRSLYAGSDDESPQDMTGQGGGEQSHGGGPCRNCQFMEQQLSEAEQKSGEWEGLYKRMMADFENFRKRVDREREEFQAAGVQKAVESLIPALDDMERAQSSLNPEMAPDKILESVKLVFGRITHCLGQVGVKPLLAVGEPFDPKFHEPVQEVETTTVPDGHVIHELRRGYTLNDKVIRPTLVNVASNPGTTGAVASPEEAPGEETPTEPEQIYDLSDIDDSPDAEESLTKKLDDYLEAPATGTTTADE